MKVVLIPANETRRQRWRNGGGWSLEILRARAGHASGQPLSILADDDPQWDCRLAIAEIDRDGPSSAYPGMAREQALVSGNGFELTFDDGRSMAAAPPHGRLSFDGADAPRCRLIDGPVRAFNVFARHDGFHVELLHRPVVGTMIFLAEAGVTWAAYLLAGRAGVKDDGQSRGMEAGDTALIGVGDAGSRRAVLDGAGELLPAKLTAAPT